MAISPEPLHFTLIPLMAPGHIIPMIDMAKSLAKRGVHITILVTPLDSTRFTPVVDRAIGSGLSIELLRFKFPTEEAGLPPGCESVDCVPSFDALKNFYTAINLLQRPLEEAMKSMKSSPKCIISDKYIPCTAELSTKLQIPRIVFDGMSCFTQLVAHRLYTSRIHESVPPSETFLVPDLPDEIEFTRQQLPPAFNPSSLEVMTDLREEIRKSELQAYGVVINSFEELEKRYLDEFRKVKNGKVWSIGPLSLSSNDDLDRAQRGNRAVDIEKCLNWLDNRNPGSVIYACHGSLSRLSPEQFIELALGLESSGRPFILVVKEGSEPIEKWISDSGFEERTKETGLLIRGWAPQVLILSHSSVGAFLTHCGWNSTLECISAGLPMITWPIFAEQFLNEKLVVQILETGVGVGAKAVVHLREEEKPENRVRRDGIKAAVEKVMDDGEEGSGRRKRAEELGKMAKRSVEEGGSSHLNITLLIEDIARLGGK